MIPKPITATRSQAVEGTPQPILAVPHQPQPPHPSEISPKTSPPTTRKCNCWQPLLLHSTLLRKKKKKKKKKRSQPPALGRSNLLTASHLGHKGLYAAGLWSWQIPEYRKVCKASGQGLPVDPFCLQDGPTDMFRSTLPPWLTGVLEDSFPPSPLP